MKHSNSMEQIRQLAAEVSKRIDLLNLQKRKLERELHVDHGFFTNLEKKK